jgi:tetratricopeptide (TPR) repeat protein
MPKTLPSPDHPAAAAALPADDRHLVPAAEPSTQPIAMLCHALAWQPNSAEHWRQLGQAYAESGRRHDAIVSFRHALRIAPHDDVARTGLARALTDSGRSIEAIQVCHDTRLAAPAVRAEAASATAEQPTLQPDNLKVGLVWADDSNHSDALLRSLPLSAFAALAGMPGVTFYALQSGAAAHAVVQPPEGLDFIDLSNVRAASADAAALARMDLVICPDCETADLAAALGRPVWIMLPAQGQRPRGGEQLARLPSIRLFRQARRGDWSTVLQQIECALTALLNESPPACPTRRALLQAAAAQADYRYGEAEQLLRQALNTAPAVTPELIRALQSFMARTQRHQLLDALDARRNAVSPAAAFWLDDLRATALARKGDRELAYGMWEKLIASGAPALPVYMHFGAALHDAKDYKRATEVWKKALALFPHAPLLNTQAARSHRENGEPAKAIRCLKRAVGVSPLDPEAHATLGVMLREQNSIAEAKQHFDIALHLDPNQGGVWDQLGYLLKDLEHAYRSAKVCFQRSLELNPGLYAMRNMATIHLELGEYEEAARLSEQVLLLQADDKDAHLTRANALFYLGRLSESVQAYEATVALNAHDEETTQFMKFRIAGTYLCLQDYEKGYGLTKTHWKRRVFDKPEWNGESLEGKTLLLYQSNGFGDTMQFLRLAPLLKPARLVCAIWPKLVPLFRGLPGLGEVHSIFDLDLNKIDFDYHINDYSLPRMFNVHPKNNPVETPYLSADPLLVRKWRDRLAGDTGFKIGIIWSGNKAHAMNHFRSSTLADWLPLAEVPGISLYNLQYNEADVEIYDHPQLRIRDVSRAASNFVEAAALMSTLDLVISVDSAPAHLAGALGRPVWLLLAARGVDWRWSGLDSSVPWYPSMRLFRQMPEQSWRDTLQQVAEELVKLLADRLGR